ncbi:MAG TPA: VWA domain-containing protein [Phycisphaerae bacterium]|nr:VWA domain-containing protein [Phycisphaerae bacterium]HNU46935.1 VWA domain-containing protein [Phycisphaerae bacterium]
MSGLALALPFSFDEPRWLWLAALVPVLALASWRSLAGLDPVRRVLALALRGMVVLLLAACLARVQSVRRSDDLTVMFLLDRSYSVHETEQQQEDYLRGVCEQVPPQDRVGVIDFARHAHLQQLPMRGGYFLPPGRLPQMPGTDRTDLAAALRLAMAMFPHDTAKRVVLLSDGNANLGDALSEARRAQADGIPIDVMPLWYRRGNEVYFERMIAPTYAEEGEMVPVRMVIHTGKPVSGSLTVYQNGQPLPLPPEQTHVTLSAGSNTFYVRAPVTSTGAQRFEAGFRPDDDNADTVPFNNSGSAFTFVAGPSRVLLVSQDPPMDAPLVEALQRERVSVELQSVDKLEDFDLLRLADYASVILANVAAASFTDQQMKDMASYVRDLGGGLIMLGGEEGFGAGGWISTPVEEVMPVSFEIKHKRVIPRGALVLIMHSCEVPRGNFWGKEMAKKSVDTISSQDYLGVVAYSYSPGGVSWEVPLDLCTNKVAVKSKIDRMQIGDMPDFDTAMRLGLQALTTGRGRDAAQKHMIIISDGDPSPPSPRLITEFKDAKVTVSTIGIGWGAHVMTVPLSNIATQTGGKFYAPRSPRELPQIFVKESKVVRRPLIVDEPFTPRLHHVNSELLAGIDAGETLPPLGGMVLTSPKENPNVQIPMLRATDDGNDPVLAHWQCELGKTVAFTSGRWLKWGAPWVEWPKFSKLWAQIVRWTLRQDVPANFDTFTRLEGNRVRVVVDALDKDADYLNFLQFGRSTVVGPDNTRIPIEFHQTGPGHYEAQFEADRPGQYLAALDVHDAHGKSLGTIRTGLSVPFSPEYRDLQTNEALLRQLAQVTGGRWLAGVPAQDDVFSHDLPPTEAKRPVWDWVLAWLLLPLFLLDVAVRRLASWLAWSIAVELVLLVVLLFGVGMAYGPWYEKVGALVVAELAGWAIRFRYVPGVVEFLTHSVVVLAHAGERSAASLQRLKTKRQRVREGLEAKDEVAGRGPATAEPEARDPALARRRFDVGDAGARQAAEDLHEALGGARTAGDWQEKRRAPAPADKGEGAGDEDVTSRLLRAKRRARRDMDDRKDE